MTVILEGIQFGESPRWHDGRLWVSDWAAGQVMTVDPEGGGHEVVATVPSFPLCIDFLPDGRLLLVDSAERRLLRREPDGELTSYADLSPFGEHPWNEVVVDASGNAYVNNIGFDFPEGDFAPGFVVLVTPDGDVRRVADELAFPNGMAITGSTLLVAESYGNAITAYDIGQDGGLANRRVWADTPGDHPDGICLDAEAALWYADVGNRHCVRVREGGEVLETVVWDWGEDEGGPSGQVARFSAPAAGRA